MAKKSGGGRLLIPFLLWSAFYSIKNYIGGASVRSVILNFITGKAATPLYYILVLLQLTLFTPYLVKNRKRWMYLITPVYLVILYIFNIATGGMPRFYETFFPAWFIFYILGMDCRSGRIKVQKIKRWWIAIALGVSFIEAFVLMKIGCSVGFASSQIKFSSFLYAAFIALFLVKNERECDKNLLSTVGDCSFGIYFSHIAVMWGVSKVLLVVGVESWFARWSFTFIFTSILSFIFVWLVRKIFDGKKLLRRVGFE